MSEETTGFVPPPEGGNDSNGLGSSSGSNGPDFTVDDATLESLAPAAAELPEPTPVPSDPVSPTPTDPIPAASSAPAQTPPVAAPAAPAAPSFNQTPSQAPQQPVQPQQQPYQPQQAYQEPQQPYQQPPQEPYGQPYQTQQSYGYQDPNQYGPGDPYQPPYQGDQYGQGSYYQPQGDGYGTYPGGYTGGPYGDPSAQWGPGYGYASDPYGYGAMSPTAWVPGMPLVEGQVVVTPTGPKRVGNKSKLAAGLLGIFLGGLGLGRFYRGFIGLGVAQLLVSIFSFGLGTLWGFVEGIMVLVANPGDSMAEDAFGNLMRS